jgi:hypothetical protein
MTSSFHETYRGEAVEHVTSDRGVGLVFAGFFAVVGLFPVLFGGSPRLWCLAVAAAFAVVALARPRLLRPFNRAWFKFGLLLHAVVTPAVMAIVFYTTVTPTALVRRMLGKDSLGLKFDRDAASYWVERVPPGPPPETMKNQF